MPETAASDMVPEVADAAAAAVADTADCPAVAPGLPSCPTPVLAPRPEAPATASIFVVSVRRRRRNERG